MRGAQREITDNDSNFQGRKQSYTVIKQLDGSHTASYMWN